MSKGVSQGGRGQTVLGKSVLTGAELCNVAPLHSPKQPLQTPFLWLSKLAATL